MSIYFMHAPEVGRIKIGFSRCWQNRFLEFLVASPTMLDVLVVAEGAIQQEQALHRIFARSRHYGEWFNATPDLLDFCRLLALLPEDARQAVIVAKIAEAQDQADAQKLTFDPVAEAAMMRACLKAWVEKHGRAGTAAVAGVGTRMAGNWEKGKNGISPVRLIRLLKHDPDPFQPFFAQAGMRFEPLQKEAGALICQIEQEAA